MSKSSQDKGLENEIRLLSMLDEMEANGEPFPVNRKGGLFVKALWAKLSGQPIEEIKKAPGWFNERRACKNRLAEIRTKLAQGNLQKSEQPISEKDSALEDLRDSSSNKTVQMMKTRMNSLKEKLDSERAEKSKLMKDNKALRDELDRLKQREDMIINGKIAH